MKTIDKIKQITQTACCSQSILSDRMLEEVMPKVIESINNQAKNISYDGFTYNSPASDYGDFMYIALWRTAIRQTVLDYLNEHHPLAWFKPMYFSEAEMSEFEKNL